MKKVGLKTLSSLTFVFHIADSTDRSVIRTFLVGIELHLFCCTRKQLYYIAASCGLVKTVGSVTNMKTVEFSFVTYDHLSILERLRHAIMNSICLNICQNGCYVPPIVYSIPNFRNDFSEWLGLKRLFQSGTDLFSNLSIIFSHNSPWMTPYALKFYALSLFLF